MIVYSKYRFAILRKFSILNYQLSILNCPYGSHRPQSNSPFAPQPAQPWRQSGVISER